MVEDMVEMELNFRAKRTGIEVWQHSMISGKEYNEEFKKILTIIRDWCDREIKKLE
jgi:hypothetical protein